MKSLAILFFLFALNGIANTCIEASDNWFLCEKDSDCIIVPNECGYSTAINLKFKDEANKRYKCLGPRVSCVQLKQKPVIGKCVFGRCETKSSLKYIETH